MARPRVRRWAAVARTAALLGGAGVASFVLPSRPAPADQARAPHACTESVLEGPAAETRVVPWAKELRPLAIVNMTTHESAQIRLYADDGSVDESSREAFERIAGGDDPHALAPRLEQLVVKAAYHFRNADILIVSAWRPNAGRHGTGEALDFKLRGVKAAILASYLRQLPRAGVGIYTHPRTQFVHLDVRDASYHWLDASPPGVLWREARLRDSSGPKRDAAYVPDMDLPL